MCRRSTTFNTWRRLPDVVIVGEEDEDEDEYKGADADNDNDEDAMDEDGV